MGGRIECEYSTLNDVGAELSSGDFITEVQVKKQDVYGARSLFYAFSRYCNNYDRRSNKYDDLRNVYSLNILDETYFKGDNIATRIFRLHDDCAKIPIDRDYIRLGYFELRKAELRNDNQRYWQMYFLDKDVPPEAPEYIRRAGKLIEYTNLGEEERYVISLEEKYKADQHAYYNTALREGLEQGVLKGREERDLEIAHNMKEKGFSEKEIAEILSIHQ